METINDRTFKHCSPILLGVLCVAIVARSAAGAITLSDPTGRAIYQRNRANLANVVVAGTYSGRADRIEARAVTRTGYGGANTDWTPIVSAPRGGAFSATLPVPAGWYDIEVRQVKGNAVVETTAVQRVGIGEVFITAGQSNAGCFGSPKQSPDDDRVSAYNINTGSWQIANDPQPGVSAVSWGIGTGGSPWPKMGDLLAAKYNVPIGIVAVAVGGSGISQWQPNTSTDYYDNCLYAAISGLYKTGFRAILWHQGETDSYWGTSASQYAASLNAAHRDIASRCRFSGALGRGPRLMERRCLGRKPSSGYRGATSGHRQYTRRVSWLANGRLPQPWLSLRRDPLQPSGPRRARPTMGQCN